MLKSKKSVLLATTATLGLLVNSGTLHAQDQIDSDAISDEVTLEEIVVTGVRGSLARALQQKRYADGITDGIASEDIVDFPDLNVSEALQRVTGVTINRVLGEGQQISVRGLASEFTRVTINGQTVVTGNAGRDIDFDVFASELFSNVSVSKAPSASQAEGGLAATVNLRTARPFDFDDTTFAISAEGVYNDLREDVDPRVSALAAGTFMDGRLGLLVSASYSQSSLRQDSVEGFRFLLTDIDVEGDGVNEFNNVEIPFIPRYILELRDRDRLGITGALQFRPTDNFDINVDVAYAEFDELRQRHSIDGLLNGNRSQPLELPTVDETGRVTRALYSNVNSRSENIRTPSDEDLLLINADVAWRFADDWELRAKFGHSAANGQTEEFRSLFQINGDFRFDFTDPVFVGIEQVDASFTDESAYFANQSRFVNRFIDDDETSFHLDLTREFPDSSFISSVEIGGRYTDRQKNIRENDDRINLPSDLAFPAGVAQSLPVDDFFSGRDNPQIVRNFLITDFDAVLANSTLVPPGFVIRQDFLASFGVEEKTYSGYVQANIESEIAGIPVRGNFGARIAHTDQLSNGFLADGQAISQGQTYTDFLPSANLTFEATDDVLFRVAASRSLTRPTVTLLSPGGNVAPTGLTANLGNPNLAPFTADQLDLSLEYYFAGDEGLLAATFFFKDVDGFISSLTTEEQINAGTQINDLGEDVSDAIFTVTRPVNGERANVTGFELTVQTPFNIFADALDGFGFLANYTHVDSTSTIQFNGQTIETALPGQSRNSFNLVGYYEKGAFSARVAYAWRDSFIDQVRASQSQRSNFTAEYGQVDLNFQYAVTENITMTLDVLNLLENEVTRFAELRNRTLTFGETGRFILLGARAKF